MNNQTKRGGITPLVDPNGFDPREEFSEFYNNPVIQKLGKKQKWSVSNNDKVPINMFALRFEGNPNKGASPFDLSSTLTLDDLTDLLPTASNCAYYMNYTVDGLVVLDIEKKCPEELKNKFLNIPYLYGEVSMSGEGYHLIIPTPIDLFKTNPDAFKCSKMQHKNKYFEVLMNHWVTFTRNTLPPSPGTQDIEELLYDLVQEQHEVVKGDISVSNTAPSGEKYDELLDKCLNRFHYTKTPDYFNNDLSRFEFGYMASLAITLTNMLKFNGEILSDSDKVWIMAQVAERQLKPREKHSTMRSGLPWLVYTAQEALAAVKNNDKE